MVPNAMIKSEVEAMHTVSSLSDVAIFSNT